MAKVSIKEKYVTATGCSHCFHFSLVWPLSLQSLLLLFHLCGRPSRPNTPKVREMFPKEFHWTMLGINSASIISNMRSLKCVLDTFNTEVSLFRILSLDGIVSLVFSLASAVTHGLAGMGYLKGPLKCGFVLMTTMPPYISGILCALMISVIR